MPSSSQAAVLTFSNSSGISMGNETSSSGTHTPPLQINKLNISRNNDPCNEALLEISQEKTSAPPPASKFPPLEEEKDIC